MSEIDCQNKIFIRDYYPLDKAVREISKYIDGFDIDDLLHLAATEVIPISLHIPEFEPLDVYLEIEEDKYIPEYIDSINANEKIEEIRIDNFTSLFNLVREDVKNGEFIGHYKVDISSYEYAGLIRADISGVWDISAWAAEYIEINREIDISKLAWLYPTFSGGSDSFIAIIAQKGNSVPLSKLVITAETLDGIIGSSEKERSHKKVPSVIKGEHQKEYHSAKRESILKAAICLISKDPELIDNNSKLAEEINDKAYKFWSNGNPPLVTKVIAELIGKAKSFDTQVK